MVRLQLCLQVVCSLFFLSLPSSAFLLPCPLLLLFLLICLRVLGRGGVVYGEGRAKRKRIRERGGREGRGEREEGRGRGEREKGRGERERERERGGGRRRGVGDGVKRDKKIGRNSGHILTFTFLYGPFVVVSSSRMFLFFSLFLLLPRFFFPVPCCCYFCLFVCVFWGGEGSFYGEGRGRRGRA